MQVLDTYLTVHGSSKGPFLAGTSYTTAEVCAAPFLVIGCTLLRAHRDYDVVSQAVSWGFMRFAMWAQVCASASEADEYEQSGSSCLADVQVLVCTPMTGRIGRCLASNSVSAGMLPLYPGAECCGVNEIATG